MNNDWQHLHHQRVLIDDYLDNGAWTPAHQAEFPDEDSLVRALHQRWVTVVDGCLETEMEIGSGSLEETLRSAYAAAITHAPALHRELDRHSANPVLRGLTDHHDVVLARATGFLRPGHAPQEGIDAMRRTLASVVVVPQQRPSLRARRRRDREVRRLVMASIRGY